MGSTTTQRRRTTNGYWLIPLTFFALALMFQLQARADIKQAQTPKGWAAPLVSARPASAPAPAPAPPAPDTAPASASVGQDVPGAKANSAATPSETDASDASAATPETSPTTMPPAAPGTPSSPVLGSSVCTPVACAHAGVDVPQRGTGVAVTPLTLRPDLDVVVAQPAK